MPFTFSRRRALELFGAGTAGLVSPWTQAQSVWPARPVNIVVPFPPGGGTDAFARPLFAAMSKALGQQFLIDNKGGAGGTVGASLAAKAAGDGYNAFMGAVHHTIAPSFYPKLDYTLERDFVPVGLVSNVPQVIVVNPGKVAAKTLPELLEHIRKNPGRLNYGSAGNGTSHHMAGELFKLQTRTFITHIPYRGAGPALQDLIAGQVDMMFDGLGSSAAHIKAGRLRAIAVASEQRAPGFAEVPTSAEGGVPSYRVSTWYGLWMPRATPREAVTAFQARLREALNTAELKAVWTGLGALTPNLWGDDFGRFVAAETQRWAEVVKASGAKLD
jgi:tripartite-type tricarboxylate transporter receptor subunit TctC